eukprot:1481468-Prymnesium_polylepis.1
MASALANEDTEVLQRLLIDGGRVALLAHLKRCGAGTLSERQYLCNGLSRLARCGHVSRYEFARLPLSIKGSNAQGYKGKGSLKVVPTREALVLQQVLRNDEPK